ncbi:hypothetical protein Bbelb_034430 [Branchiostoma belcheri]|nr:hypothetical protein Bbelb_034430 [Branchiostoma belcheri]
MAVTGMEKTKKASKYAYDGKKDWSNTWPTRGEKRHETGPARLGQRRGSSDDDAGNMLEEHNCQHPLEPTTLGGRRKVRCPNPMYKQNSLRPNELDSQHPLEKATLGGRWKVRCPNPMYKQNSLPPNARNPSPVYPQTDRMCGQNTDQEPELDTGEDSACVRPRAVTHRQGVEAAIRSADNDDISTCSQQFAVTHQNGDETASWSASSDDDVFIQPYAVRYKEDDNDTNRPTDNGRQTVGIAPNDDEVRPYAVAYMCKDDTVVVRGLNSGQTQHKTKTASNRRNNISTNLSGLDSPMNDMWPNASDSHTHDIQHSSSARHLDPMYLRFPLHPNPIKLMPNPLYVEDDHRTCGCEYRRVCVAVVTVIILVSLTFGGTFAVLYFNTTGRDPTPAVDTNCTRGDTVCHGYGQETMADLTTMSTISPPVNTTYTPRPGPPVCCSTDGNRVTNTGQRLRIPSPPLPLPYYMASSTLRPDSRDTLSANHAAAGVGGALACAGGCARIPPSTGKIKPTNGSVGRPLPTVTLPPTYNRPQENPDGGANSTITFGGPGSAPGTFLQPRGVAISADNEIFVSDMRNKRVQVFDMSGVLLRLFETAVPGQYGRRIMPHDVAMGGEGRVWVVGRRFLSKSLYVVQYSQNGQPVTKFKGPCGHVCNSLAVAVGKEKITVVTYDEILMFGLDGTFYRRCGKSKHRQWFASVTSDMEGKIYVTDSGVSKVKVYNSSGHFLLSFGDGLSQPRGICVATSGHIIVANLGKGRIDMFNITGEFVRTVVKVAKPWGIAVGPNGQLVVTSEEKNTVSIFPHQLVYPE